jgi:copper(I)-binding protein
VVNLFRREAKVGPPAATLGSIEIRQPWARPASAESIEGDEPPESVGGGGFFTMTNNGASPDRLIAASSPAADKIEIHAIKVVGSGIAMCPLKDGLVLAPGVTLTLKPRGYHLLLTGLRKPLTAGTSLPVTLTFEKAGSIDIELAVEAPGLVGQPILHDEAQRG